MYLYSPKTVKCGDIEDISPIPLCPGDQGDQTFDATFAVPSNFKIPGGVISGLIGSVSRANGNTPGASCTKGGYSAIHQLVIFLIIVKMLQKL